MSGNNAKEIVEEYISSLTELTNNSKPLINMLTILAEDYIEHAAAIVKAVEEHLFKVRSEIKLPVLYLIDSIIKNVNKAYLRLFGKNIVNTFCHVFEHVDENTRVCMWKLRTTWNEVFPTKRLYALDVRVQKLDPAWPITSQLPSSVKNTSKQQKQVQQQPQPAAVPVSKVPPVQPTATVTPTVVNPTPVVKLPPLVKPASSTEAEMQKELQKRQKLLLELQKQKLDLELMQAKANLEVQRRQLDKQSTLLKPELFTSPEGALEASVAAAISPSQVLEKHPNAASSLFKNDNKTGKKIAPASSVAVAGANSRDPRLKLSATSTESAEELLKQQIIQQYKLHFQNNLSAEQSSLLKNVNKGTSESEVMTINNKSLDNKRDKDSSQKKDNTVTIAPNTNANLTISRNNNISKDQPKGTSTKSSSNRSCSSSVSKISSSSSSSSSSSRKSGSKSRSKTPSSSPSPTKTSRYDENSSPPPEKRSKKSKSRKAHSPSPVSPISTSNGNNNSSSSSYRIPRRTNIQELSASSSPTTSNGGSSKSQQSVVDEDDHQSSSLTNSPLYGGPASFKDIRSSARHRNYVRRNKEGSRSPETDEDDKNETTLPDASKDEDLRTPIVSVNVAASGAAALDKKEDLDLRILAVPGGKRQASDAANSTNSKRSKNDRFDALFGSEDVDLRTLTNPKAGRPPTPPPPVISNEDKAKDNCWAKLKTPVKTERDTATPKPLTDRNRDRLGRPRLYSMSSTPDDPKDRRFRGLPPTSREFDKQNERNIEIIMKQAAEQLDTGEITKSQYNKLIQDVLHMSEDQKLRAAQRKEQEMGMLMWEKGEAGSASSQNFISGNEENVRKEPLPMHPRGPAAQGGPRWPGPWHQPWNHPPPFGAPGGPPPPPFPPIAPWQNHPRMFGGPIRPEFHAPPFPPPPYNPRMAPPPMMMPNGPIGSMTPAAPMNSVAGTPISSSMPSSLMMTNGPVRSEMAKRASPSVSTTNSLPTTNAASENMETDRPFSFSGPVHSGELPPADPKLLEEIAKDTMKSINIDSVPREIRYYGNIGIVFMNWDDPRDIGFQDGSRRIFINGKDSILCNFNEDYKEFTYEGEIHRIKLGTPTRELYVDDKWYECYFGGRPISVELGNKQVSINLEGPPPQVKIGTIKRTDLVIGKINLIINARTMVPIFLDSKPQMFEIEGKQCTLEFTDALQTVLLNGRPFKVEFGGLPKPVIIQNKKHFIRFSVLPRGIRAGYVKIMGMRGEQPVLPASTDSRITPAPAAAVETTNVMPLSTTISVAATTATTTTTVTAAPANPSVPPGLDLDSTSQDGMDTSSGSKDLQLDVLSSVVPSAMAPSSGLSYQAEPAENPPAPAPTFSLPLNLSELFQRLVETGIVPSLESKKPEEEEKKEPEVISVAFDKPETLKTKNPAVVTALYSGMQCSSCGARFAPEMATRYSHHLDWHFRQNRKERDSTRKAHSRAWYYDISDWTQFEEIEDLEDRAQSWFETEKQTADADGGATDDSPTETRQPSLPAGSNNESYCEVCHEAFEQFYNEEKEEWHLRPAVTFEEKYYHPLCLEDHKKSLEKSAKELEEKIAEMEGTAVVEVEIEIKEEPLEKKPQIKEETVEVQECIQEPKVEPVEPAETVVPPEVPEIPVEFTAIKSDENIIKEEIDIDEEPIEIIEPLPKKIEIEEILDSSDDEPMDSKDLVREQIRREEKPIIEKIPDDVPLIFENVKVKEEPLDEPEPMESIIETKVVDTTQVAVKSSIDGNVELESAAPAMPTGPSRIKINISKPLNTVLKELDDSKDKKPIEGLIVEPTPAPAKPLIPAAVKPSLQSKKLSILPTVEKGHELSALCSIM